MKNPRAYKSYFGGKAGNGTYQTIINHIPPHRTRYSLFAGNDALTFKMKLPEVLRLIDKDINVIMAWNDHLLAYPGNVKFTVGDAFEYLERMKSWSDNVVQDTFLFLDPLYLMSTRKSQRAVYRYEMSTQEHADLLTLITSVELQRFKIMLCCYPDDFYSFVFEKLPNWHYVDYQSMTRNGLAWERIYMNYPAPTELHDYSYIGGNFREREKFKRISGNLVKKLSGLDPVLRNSIVADIVNSLNQVG
jgi:DNA adenine methylase